MPRGCVLLPFDTVAGMCAACGTELAGRQRRWCSKDCERGYQQSHYWNFARAAALQRDQRRCVKCGWSTDFYLPGDNPYQLTSGQFVFWTRANLFKGADPDTNWLEVNHIDPRNGRGYGTGCWNHLTNLETLCHKCHVAVTRRQRIARARKKAA